MEKKEEKMLDIYINRTYKIGLILSILMMIIVKLFRIKDILTVKLSLYLFSISIFFLGIWVILGVIYQWKSFKKSYKRIDFEKYLGGFGNIIYLLLGTLICMCAIFLLYKTYKINYL